MNTADWILLLVMGGPVVALYWYSAAEKMKSQRRVNAMSDAEYANYVEYMRTKIRYQRAQDWGRVGAAFWQASRDSDRAAQAARDASRDD